MANRMNVSVENGMKSPEWIENVEPFMKKIMEHLEIDGEEISLLFCSDPTIRRMNMAFRKIDSATDVLSFENGEEETDGDGNSWYQAGDIAISLETLPKNAEYFNVDEDEELRRLIVHGILHLNGYDHGEEHVEKGVEPKCEMLRLQKEIMAEFADEKIMKNNG